ncbi:MAG: ribosomal protein S6 [Saprospiraceae bacterium]|jgi:ribosomal protein S6
MSNLTPSGNNGLSISSDVNDLLKLALKKPIKEIPYTAQITRNNPTAFIFLLDQSGSMNENMTWKGKTSTKADVATMVINEILEQLQERAVDGNDMKEYYDLCVIGYGGEDARQANISWQGALSGKEWVNMTTLRASRDVDYEVLEVKSSRSGEVVKTFNKKGWIAKKAKYLTPMKDAMQKAYDLLTKWMVSHSHYDGFPPTIINITDGEATDANAIDLIKLANEIKSLHTTDGHVLFFNVNINSNSDNSVIFPSTISELPKDEYADTLFKMSSKMPNVFKREIAYTRKIDMEKQYYAMAFNANAQELVQFMNIGTSQTKNNLNRNA